jgi:TRAP-type uncharacterized transport system substrate-binding protein
MAEAFVAGEIDAFIHVIGTPRDEQVSRDVNGIMALQLGSDAAAEEWVRQSMPVGSLYRLEPTAALTTITEPTQILQYDYYVYTHINEAAENIVKLIEAMRNNKPAMVESVAGFAWFEPDAMFDEIGVPYHPAAEAFYRDHGLVQ